jgi:signal transduction histidine kinase
LNAPVNILLVDDEPRNLEVLEGVLQHPEHRLVRAANADEALLALLHEEFAVLVLDIQMPGISGLELAHMVKQREKTQSVPIIFLTAFYQDEQRMLEGYNVGAVDYLTKPVNPQVLRSKVGVFVDLFRKTAELRQSNSALAREVAQRQKAEEDLRFANDELEARVQARTAALSQARDVAERAGRAKDEFLAALSHELRTPLNPVLLIASEAMGNPEFSPVAREYFAIIRKNVELEARLIDDLLDLTRITRGKLTLDLRPREIHAVLRDAIATVAAEMTEKRIQFTTQLTAADHWVTADNVRLQQVFWNVLKNAVKFTPEGGVITVSTCNPADKKKLIVEISDSGIGLSPAEIERIFEAFAQGDHASTGNAHRFGGLGLGLSISRSLVEHHGGVLSVRSEGLGKGSTFVIDLPLAPAGQLTGKNPAKADADTSTHVGLGGAAVLRKILLVEDHEPTRKALATLLKRRNFDVTTAGSVEEARDAAAKETFEVLISDIGLPDGTGFELMADLKQRQGLIGIALTGYGMEDDIARSREAGFKVHLTKPVVVQSLDKALAELMSAN